VHGNALHHRSVGVLHRCINEEAKRGKVVDAIDSKKNEKDESEEEDEYVDAYAALVGAMLHHLPWVKRTNFMSKLTTALEKQHDAIRHSELVAMTRTPLISPSAELYPLLYDLLFSFPTELVRLVCSYHCGPALPSRLVKVVPAVIPKYARSTVAVLSDDLLVNLPRRHRGMWSAEIISLQSGEKMREWELVQMGKCMWSALMHAALTPSSQWVCRNGMCILSVLSLAS
jgi:hypothetical protein